MFVLACIRFFYANRIAEDSHACAMTLNKPASRLDDALKAFEFPA